MRSLVRIFLIVFVSASSVSIFLFVAVVPDAVTPSGLAEAVTTKDTAYLAWARQGLVRRVPQLWVVQEGQSS